MTSQLTLSSCIDGPLTHKLWDSLGMDQYIRNYPGGQNMTLTQYTRQIHAANFICGLGRHCLAGQPCAPVAKMDWLVLYSVQQWNMYMNSLYEAVQGAILMVRESAAAAITDFTPPVKWMGLAITTGVLAAIVLAITGALLLSPFNLLGATALEGAVAAGVEGEVIAGAPVAAAAAGEAGVAAPAAAAAAAGEAGVAAPAAAVAAGEAGVAAPAVGTIKLRRRHHQETLGTDKFSAYANLDNDIGRLQLKLNKVISMNINSVLNAPISSDLGVYNVIKNATFLAPNPNQAELQQSAKKLAELTMISELFKSLKIFAVIGNGLCNGAGPNGALQGDQSLSYCTEDKVMMQIVRADGDKMNPHIPNATFLSSKYGFDTKYLISVAWSCQEKYQTVSKPDDHFHPTNKTAVVETTNRLNGDCAFNIPVCDTRLPEIRKRIVNHDDVVIACREAGNLDI